MVDCEKPKPQKTKTLEAWRRLASVPLCSPASSAEGCWELQNHLPMTGKHRGEHVEKVQQAGEEQLCLSMGARTPVCHTVAL